MTMQTNNSFVKIIKKQQEKPQAARTKANKPKRIITKKAWI